MTDRLLELKRSIEGSSQLIGNQLQGIDSSLLSAAISLIISGGLIQLLGFLIYWIPISFLLMLAVLVFSTVKSYLFPKKQKIKVQKKHALVQIIQLSNKKLFLLNTSFKNSAPLFMSISMIFLVSFAMLVAKTMGVIAEVPDFPTVVPIISALVFIPLPIINNYVINLLEKTETIKLRSIGCLRAFLLIVFMFIYFIYIFSLFALPIWSLILLNPIYFNGSINIWPVLLVLFFQIITALAFLNYFSAISSKKELTVALYNLSSIHNRITDYLLSDITINNKTYQTILEDYFKAKPYEIFVDNTLLINFYSLRPNPSYLSSLDKKNK